MYHVRVLTVLIVIFQLFAAVLSELRVLVTKEQCGRSIDLTWKRKVYLDYEGAELWNDSSICVINITTSNYNEKICIINTNTALIDLECSWTLSYYVGGYKGYSGVNEKSCTDFSSRSFCDSNRVSSVVYRENLLFEPRMVTVNVIVFLSRIKTLRVLVTEDQCGRSIDHTDIVKQELYLDYEGAELGDTLSNCVINITNSNVHDMICIKSEGTYLDFDCATLLKYYIGGWTSWSVYGKSYTCSEFYLTPLCDRNSVSSVVYRYTYLKTGSVKVKLFTKRYVATTTTRYKPTWSSSDFDDDDDDDSSNSVGTVVGIIVGILVTFVIVISCVCAKARRNSAPKPEYGPSPTTETHASAPTVEPSAPVVHYYQRNLDESHALTFADSYHPQPQSENAGNHTHNSTNQQVPNQDTQTGYQFDKPPPSYDSLHSAPPPPYPGYSA